ncbi:hypothetical protein NE237_017232 [Protea cynaroides]|uniref:Uncharacterized protein n=1 Tax=Protea cynaroides TaxID=273540 RepID=A0A9Q0QMQ6_9MAGN|nr:hypothetical protein NE237_017232 [Protea cynaroides]
MATGLSTASPSNRLKIDFLASPNIATVHPSDDPEYDFVTCIIESSVNTGSVFQAATSPSKTACFLTDFAAITLPTRVKDVSKRREGTSSLGMTKLSSSDLPQAHKGARGVLETNRKRDPNLRPLNRGAPLKRNPKKS